MKEKAIEDETIELSNAPTEKKTKKPHRRRAIVVTVVVLALLTAGGIAWKTHADRLMTEARADCAAASERLRTATNDWNTLLNGSAADAAKTDRKSVKDAKMLDALSKTMKATIPKTVSCKADSRAGVQEAAKAITANAAWYKTHAKTLSKAVKAVESSKLDKTVDDAQALYDATSGKVQDDKTRASLLDAIKKRDADAIGKAVKTVNESKAAKEKADAEAKAKAEQEAAAAAAAAAQQAQQSWSPSGSGYTGNGYSTGGYSGNTWSGGSPTSTGGGASTPSAPSGGSSGSSSSGSTGGSVHYDWEDRVTTNESCASGGFCPLG